MRHVWAASLALLVLSGCKASYWPEYGQGGAAERYPLHDESTERRVGLLQELALVRDRREWLRQAGAEDCLPGHVVKAQHLENRIAREIDGGLLSDSELSLMKQRGQLLVLERRLQFMTEAGTCLPSVLATDWELATERHMDDPSQIAFERQRVRETGSNIYGHIAQANGFYRDHLESESQRIHQGRTLPADLPAVSDIVTTSEQIDLETERRETFRFIEMEFDRENF